MQRSAALFNFVSYIFAVVASRGLSESSKSSLERSITPNNTCGGPNNGYTCDPDAAGGGPCCSSAGFCGSADSYCGAGCQWAYSDPGCNYSKKNTCGSANGFTCKPDSNFGGACCSKNGFCGYTAAYCGSGCQSAYGSCFGTSSPAIQSGGMYVVGGVGAFTDYQSFTFPTDHVLPSGLIKSNGPVETPPTHEFLPKNVDVQNGFLRLTVPGGQKKLPKCGEVSTKATFLHASVRTQAIFSDVPGTCHGNFFYKSDRQEIDIEYLTDPKSKSNPKGEQPLMYTNQANDGNTKHATYAISPSPADRTTTVHEYRVDWIEGKTLFYLDGVLQKTFTTNVPTKPGPWVWNNWSDGDINFTAGPPLQDNTFLIQRIDMYFNSTS